MSRPYEDIWAPESLDPMDAFAYKTYATIIASILQSNKNAKNDFIVGTVRVMPMYLHDVGTAVLDGRIQFEFKAGLRGSAQYEPDKDALYFQIGMGPKILEDLWARSVVVHEAVHAVNDMVLKKKGKTVQINDEIAAYVAQAMYVRQHPGYEPTYNPEGKRNKTSEYVPFIKDYKHGSEEQKLMRCAFDLADKVLFDKAYSLMSDCWDEYYSLYKQIQETPPYSDDSEITTRVVKYSGLKIKPKKDVGAELLKGVPKAKVGPPKLPKKK